HVPADRRMASPRCPGRDLRVPRERWPETRPDRPGQRGPEGRARLPDRHQADRRRLKLPRQLELELAWPDLLRGAGAHETVPEVETLGVVVAFGHPQEDLPVAMRPDP